MEGPSRASLRTLRDAVSGRGDAQQLSDELYAVVGLLATQGSLRRALTDPALEVTRKTAIIDQLLGKQLAARTIRLVKTAVELRWSESRDLVDALEELAVDSALAVAEDAGQLDEVEDELFRFERILDSETALRSALTDPALPDDRKRELLHRLLDGKVSDVTFSLLERAVIAPRGRTIEGVITDLSTLAAKRRERLIARVTTAVELTDQELTDLAAALKRNFGSDIQLQVVVDPELLGGLTVRIGDELIDGSVARQLAEARRRLTGRSGSGSNRT
jgi:F-type H+-transporting ATPase subunit delta